MFGSKLVLQKLLLAGVVVGALGSFVGVGAAFADQVQACRAAAQPPETAGSGVYWKMLEPSVAIPLCQQAVQADPNDHASIAFLARALWKDGQKPEAAQLLSAIKDTTDPDALVYLAVLYRNGAGEVPKDLAVSLGYAKRAADAGNVYAMYRLALLYELDTEPFHDVALSNHWLDKAIAAGNGLAMKVRADRIEDGDPEAVSWYEKALEAGNPGALNDLGRAYRWGVGVTKDSVKAAEYFARGSELGYEFSAYQLARMYLYGWGLPEDAARALALLERARDLGRQVDAFDFYYALDDLGETDKAVAQLVAGAEKGEASAQSMLGSLYYLGNYVEKDVDKAITLSLKAGLAGELRALLSAWYWIVDEDPSRIPEALPHIRQLAAQGDPAALEVLGHAYEAGHGVPKDYLEAARYYQQAIEAGDVYARWRMARLVSWGALGFWDPALARDLLSGAAEKGNTGATIELAELHLKGEGIPKDALRARELLLSVAETGNSDAQRQLGHAYLAHPDQDPKQAAEWYAKAVDSAKTDRQKWRAARSLGALYADSQWDLHDHSQAQKWYKVAADTGDAQGKLQTALYLIQEASPESLSQAALYLVEAVSGGAEEAASVARQATRRLEEGFADTDDPLHAVLTAPSKDLARGFERIGRQFEEARIDCAIVIVDCGRVSWQRLDLAQASEWYRRAGDAGSAQLRLGRLLLAQPQLEQSAGEGLGILAKLDLAAARVLLTVTDGLAPQQAADAFAKAVSGSASANAARTAALASIGRFGDAAIAPGWQWLDHHADQKDEARIGKLAVMTFLGAYDDAATLLETIPDDVSLELEHFDYSLRKSLTYLMLNLRDGAPVDTAQLSTMRRLLTAFTRFDPEPAAEMLELLNEVERRVQTKGALTPLAVQPQVDVAQRIAHLQERIQKRSTKTGFSPTIIPLFQKLAELQAETGDVGAARNSVYQSIAFARSMNDATRHLGGSLVYHLEMACWLQKGSSLLFAFGEDAAGLTLAKASVNELQLARGRLAGLPQDLQTCFRESVATQYRQIADLLIRYQHFDEAQWVLDQLKDLETYRYGGRDTALAGRAFSELPMTQTQTSVMQQIHGLPLGNLVQLRQRLDGSETQDGMETLRAQLEDAQEQLAVSLDMLSDTVERLGDSTQSELPREISSRSIRRLGGRLKRLDGAAMVYSVSLPDATHFLIVSGEGTQHHELKVPRNDLEQAVVRLRTALSDPRNDPLKPAQAFHDQVWVGVEQALDAIEAKHVLLSLDGTLRNVPIVALHDGAEWLLGRRDYVVFTSASRDLLLDDEALDDLRVEAFGASRGGAGFTPLPFVRSEVASIVGTENAAGSRVWLDDDFDEKALESGMRSGAPVVHVATHFHLTDHEDTSRMLLGNGQTLSVGELKSYARNGRFDLADVHMMVLSACQTALANGSELESLAATLQWEGVRSVVATLWPVADRSTAVFMATFYDHLQDGHSRSEAMRQAQLAFASSAATAEDDENRSGVSLKSREKKAKELPALQHPFYWAGFQIIGQWR